jgi:cell division septation protein DedD
MKARLPAVAVLTISLATLATFSAQAQGVYRCGNDYGQTPCPAGKALQVDDSRTAEQKKSAEDVAAGNRKTADAMEKARLAQEARAAPAVIAPVTLRPVEKPVAPVKKKSSKKKKDKAEQANESRAVVTSEPSSKVVKEKKGPAKKRKSKAS